ncbi:Glycosyl transferase [Macleaya cordata]|uniref:Glycosyl transferase n=1 Tax=Macleaya cordata TaxID=56857 RepID=A0A200R6U5_MACCD|nr:Glycosyl transferase [Macleaya cordata]
MAFINNKPKKPIPSSQMMSLQTTLFFIVLFTILALSLLLCTPSSTTPCTSSSSSSSTTTTHIDPFSGDLRYAQFAWNRLPLVDNRPPPTTLKIAVFSRKWPVNSSPGGMERHALTLYTALARRGHQIHIYTSPPLTSTDQFSGSPTTSPQIHFHEGQPGQWRYNKAWDQFDAENQREPFDVVHSESVALPHWLARGLSNLAVSWHGIALESLQSSIYQDLTRKPNEPMSSSFNKSIQGTVPKVLNEIRFFHNYAHHVAISDSCGEMLRDVYQIPNSRVHVILNGVDSEDFVYDVKLGNQFRAKFGVPKNASLVLGVAGRLVKDKGHPLLHEAFSKLITLHRDVYLIVAGSGPWEQRYRDLGPQVIVLGSMRPTELRAFYNSIDVFVNPTLRPQGLDLTLMEAMMSGKPVLASRFPSIKGTIVVDDEFGFMFSPNVESLLEALEVVVKEGSERLARRGKACQKYASSMFTARKMALAYERLFLCMKNVTFCQYPLRSD